MPFLASIINPKYFINLTSNSYLLILSYNPTSFIYQRTFYIYSRYSFLNPEEQTRISSIYIEQNSSRKSLRAQLIYFQKVLGVFTKLKGVISYSQSPYYIRKAIFYSSPLVIRILQKAAMTLSFVNYFAFPIFRRVLQINRSKYQSFFVSLFRPR